jgi:hypothetical protein
VSRRQGERWAAEQQPAEYQQAPPPPPPAQAESDTDDMIAQLKQLGELHEAGVLTDEEFAAQKAKIMSQ